MAHDNSCDNLVDMSLRLWSDQVSLAPVLKKLGFEVRHSHEKGQAIASAGRFAGRLADRHYASLAHGEGKDADVGPWLKRILDAMSSDQALSNDLKLGRITATVWIALFGDDVRDPPQISPDLVAAATHAHVTILIENYTRFDSDGVPEKTWLNLAEFSEGRAST